MNELQILQNRANNCIQNINFKLREEEAMPLYNDLLILKQIIPSLNK